MLNLMRIACICVLTIFFSCSEKNEKPSEFIDMSSYGLSEDKDATPVIIKALEDALKIQAKGIILPKGTYHFSDNRALEKYLAISNNDNSLNRMVFSIIGFNNFTIDGQGSKFIFDGEMVPFVLEHSKNITIKNLSIDWNRPFYGQGEVVAVDEKERTFDILINGEFEYEIHHDRLYFNTTRGFHKIQQNLFWYPNGGATVHNVNSYKLDPWSKWPNDSYEATDIKRGIVRIKTFKQNELPEIGWIWVAKGRNGERINPAIRLYRCEDVYFENVAIHHSGGMGIIGEKSKNISMDHIQVLPSPNSKRAISTTADATHFVNCKGTISITNSYFSNMMDDATNVHGIYVSIKEIIGKNRVGVKQMHKQQYGFDFAQKGDTLRFIDNKTLLSLGEGVVKEYKWYNEEYQELTFEKDINPRVKKGYALDNISWVAGLQFSNNIVEKNRARGIIFSTAGKVVVENNKFSSMMAAISISADANFWFESGPSKDVAIRNNEFINCATGGKGNAVIMITPIIGQPSHEKGYFNQNINIYDNRFYAFDKAILSASSVENLTFSNNHLIYDGSLEALFANKTTFELFGCNKVKITNNTFNDFHDGSIQNDSITFSNIILEKNLYMGGRVEVEELKGRKDIL